VLKVFLLHNSDQLLYAWGYIGIALFVCPNILFLLYLIHDFIRTNSFLMGYIVTWYH